MTTKTTTQARTLRQTPTQAEQTLWRLLRNRRLKSKFRRQHPVGPYIADFACPAARLIIEADGGHHTPETDAPRTKWLTTQGWHLLRFWNTEILQNPEGVLAAIEQALAATLPPQRHPQTNPPKNPSPAS